MSNHRRVIVRYWKPVVVFMLIPLLGSWLADESRDWYLHVRGWKPDYQGEPSFTIPLLFVLLAIISCIAAVAARDLFRPRNIALGPKRHPDPHPHVVLFLSDLSAKVKFVEGIPETLSLTDSLKDDLEEMGRRKNEESLKSGEVVIRWSWEMPLRGLWQHRDVLRFVTLVCSKESLPQAQWFAQLIERYKKAFTELIPGGVRLLVRCGSSIELKPCTPAAARHGDPATQGWNFEEYDELFNGLVAMIDQLTREGQREADVIIDVTGGQKPNSIVGALLTVNRRAKFQYVQTNTPCEVISYDLMTDPVGV